MFSKIAGDEAGKKAAADEAARIRVTTGYYIDSYGRYQGNLNQNNKNEQIISTSEQKAMDKAFNEGFYGTDILGYTITNPISPNKPSTRNKQQNDIYKGDPFLEGLYGIESSVQSSTASAKNNANQHPWQTDDDHYAFMEGLMGENYIKELQANNKNTAQNKQEKYSNMANNKNNSAGSTSKTANTAIKKTVCSEGLHYLPNGGTDSYGRELPAGSYIRVVNGKEYILLPNDPRIKERIEAEYKARHKTQLLQN